MSLSWEPGLSPPGSRRSSRLPSVPTFRPGLVTGPEGDGGTTPNGRTMKIPTPVKCKDCGGENDLDCPCTGLIESAKELHPEPANDEPGLILRLLAPLRAGYYVVDRP